MYRMSSDIAPYATHPDMPQFHYYGARSGCRTARLRQGGARAGCSPLVSPLAVRRAQLRRIPALVKKSIWDLDSQAEMLDRMELGPEAVMVIHVGGSYGDRHTSAARWVETWKTFSEPVRRRLVLEHDDLRFSPADTLWIHEHTGRAPGLRPSALLVLQSRGPADAGHHRTHAAYLAPGGTPQAPLFLSAHGDARGETQEQDDEEK